MYTDKICPSGYYCPNGTEFDLQYPCPVGTFNNLTGKTRLFFVDIVTFIVAIVVVIFIIIVTYSSSLLSLSWLY
jgi:hypothetical protein